METVIPGKSNPHAVTGETNLLKALEYALGNGRSMIHPELAPGLETGEPETLDTYEKLEAAVYRQIEHILNGTCRNILRTTNAAMVNKPRPYKSLLTEDCMENGLDFNEHGAKYDYYQVMLGGIPNLADSLMVVRKFVYEKKKYTLRELIEILAVILRTRPSGSTLSTKHPSLATISTRSTQSPPRLWTSPAITWTG